MHPAFRSFLGINCCQKDVEGQAKAVAERSSCTPCVQSIDATLCRFTCIVQTSMLTTRQRISCDVVAMRSGPHDSVCRRDRHQSAWALHAYVNAIAPNRHLCCVDCSHWNAVFCFCFGPIRVIVMPVSQVATRKLLMPCVVANEPLHPLGVAQPAVPIPSA